jgi:ABC-type Na+ efflux pump permease subunit
MSKTLLIFGHELLHMGRRTGFIILTLALLGLGIYRVASGAAKPRAEVTRIVYVVRAGSFERFTDQGNITLLRFATTEAAWRREPALRCRSRI